MSPSRTRVLHILRRADHSWTSIATVVQSLHRLQPGVRHEVLFLAPPGALSLRLSAEGVSVHHVSWSGSFRDPAGWLRFMRWAWKKRIDIVHLHFGGKSLALSARWILSSRRVFSLHSSHSEDSGELCKVPAGPAVIGISEHVLQVTKTRGCVIHTGVEVPGVPAEPGSSNRIGVLCRLVKSKRVDQIIAAFAHLANKYPEATLHIYGDGPEEESLRQQIAALALPQRAFLQGWIEDPLTVLASLGIFIAISDFEGLPVGVLQAMSAGLPVIASDVGGLPEAIAPRTGFLVPSQDHNALIEALDRLLGDPDLRARMGKAGRERIANEFRPEEMARKVAEIYLQLMARKK